MVDVPGPVCELERINSRVYACAFQGPAHVLQGDRGISPTERLYPVLQAQRPASLSVVAQRLARGGLLPQIYFCLGVRS